VKNRRKSAEEAKYFTVLTVFCSILRIIKRI